MTTPSPPRGKRRVALESTCKWTRKKIPSHVLIKMMMVVCIIWSLRHSSYSHYEFYNQISVETDDGATMLRSAESSVLMQSQSATFPRDSITSMQGKNMKVGSAIDHFYASNKNARRGVFNGTASLSSLKKNVIGIRSSSLSKSNLELRTPPWQTEFEPCTGENTLSVDDLPLVKSLDYKDQPHYANRNYTIAYHDAGYFDRPQLEKLIPMLREACGNDTVTLIPCRFHPKVTVKLQHFAHTMEQLYMCIDHWMTVRKYWDHTKPILLFDNETQAEPWHKGLVNTPFLQGIMQILESQLGLEQQSTQDFLIKHPAFNNTNETLLFPFFRDVHNGYLFQHVKDWNLLVQQHLDSQKELYARNNNGKTKEVLEEDSSSSQANTLSGHCDFQPPRINILSRRTSRRIVNADVIAATLSKIEYSYNPSNNKTNNAIHATTSQKIPSVSVEFFEGSTFEEQVKFFRSTDILISSHGAQLTGLPLMADRNDHNCKQIVELYPQNYALPYYFGSLAYQAGLAHSYVYLTNNSTDKKMVLPWELRNCATYRERVHARKAKLCPDPDAVMGAIIGLVYDWHACRCSQLAG